jgi:predicted amidophosphoribosyltransferase
MSIGIGEIIVILFLIGVIVVIFAAFYFLAKHLTNVGDKACPHCAEKIKEAAKVCPHCQRDVTGV